jgi:hypothetical protein
LIAGLDRVQAQQAKFVKVARYLQAATTISSQAPFDAASELM